MNIEQAREYALSIHAEVTEAIFATDWLKFSIGGKWFMVTWLNAPEPRVAVKCNPETAAELRERYEGVTPSYHMNKRLWNDLYLDSDLTDKDICRWIRHSYDEVVKKLPRKLQEQYAVKGEEQPKQTNVPADARP